MCKFGSDLLYEKITGSLVFALAKIDQGEYEEAKSYIVGALQLFDDQYKENVERPKVGEQRESGNHKTKRFKKGNSEQSR